MLANNRGYAKTFSPHQRPRDLANLGQTVSLYFVEEGGEQEKLTAVSWKGPCEQAVGELGSPRWSSG